MKKLIGTFAAGALALGLSGFAYAADDSHTATQSEPRTEQNQTGQTGDTAKREQEYLMALKRCEALGAADKQKCVDAVKKKYQM